MSANNTAEVIVEPEGLYQQVIGLSNLFLGGTRIVFASAGSGRPALFSDQSDQTAFAGDLPLELRMASPTQSGLWASLPPNTGLAKSSAIFCALSLL